MIKPAASFFLLDIGNTRAKWSYVSGLVDPAVADLSLNHGFFDRLQISDLSSLSAEIQPTIVTCVGVVDKELIQEWLHACQKKWPNAQCLEFKSQAKTTIPNTSLVLKNNYLNPENLGADRWAAILGAQSLFQKTDLLIVNAGTATTIDYLTSDGLFSGGWIVPGFELMLKSLSEGTAALPDLRKNIANLPAAQFGQSTQECILQGCLASQVGAILRAQEISQAKQVILSGGNAPALNKELQSSLPNLQLRSDPYVVLRGLYAWASHQPESA